MSISYEYYKIFYYVGRYHSFNRAAKVLMNSQPNITRAMNNLESELGCTLFERSHRGVSLTKEGEVLYKHVEEAHRLLVTGEEMTRKAAQNRTESVSLGISTGITDLTVRNHILIPIRDFSHANPSVNLQITNAPTPALIDSVNEGGIDLAIITTTQFSDPALRTSVLYSFNEVPIAGNSFRNKLYGRPVSLTELVTYPIITLSKNTETFTYHDQLFAKHGVILSPYIETHTMRQALAFVESDMGITCLDEDYARPSIEEGKIFQINVIEGIPHREISLIKSTNARTHTAMGLEKEILRFNSELEKAPA
ncbi:MAG: LysR family transcriptional regulator [Eubacterium sp.]|nr:LysR family transcriptional regulator [Eubacterium sp.]